MTASIDIVKSENISETELQLSTKLEAILKRPPKRHHARAEVTQKRAREKVEFENIEAAALDYNLLTNQTPEPTSPGEDNVSDKPIETDDPKASDPPHRDLHLSTLVKTTRRARYRDGARQVGSWVITLAVTGFITCCVAIMLLGLPKQLDPTAWISAHVTSQDAPTPVPTTKVQTLEIKRGQQ